MVDMSAHLGIVHTEQIFPMLFYVDMFDCQILCLLQHLAQDTPFQGSIWA